MATDTEDKRSFEFFSESGGGGQQAAVEQVDDVRSLLLDIAVDRAGDEASPDRDIESRDFVQTDILQERGIEA